MQDKTLMGGVIVTIGGVLLVFLAWFFLMRPNEVASEPITALPIELNEGNTRFTILSNFSETRFIINEKLRGSKTVVVGATNQVAAEFGFNFDDLSTAQIGPIRINARNIATDNEFRDTAIRNRILFTEEYEYITFVPTEIVNLPDSASIGDRIQFEIIGDLTIRDQTHSETFVVDVIVEEDVRLRGKAATIVERANYGLEIPEAPGVADVDPAVILELDFVAVTVVETAETP